LLSSEKVFVRPLLPCLGILNVILQVTKHFLLVLQRKKYLYAVKNEAQMRQQTLFSKKKMDADFASTNPFFLANERPSSHGAYLTKQLYK
jgi:hypothetical protein